MLPGFTALISDSSFEPAVRLAGLWDAPDQKTCVPRGTETFCTGLVMWCRDVFYCRGPNDFWGHEESRTPYPCGVCVGVTDPSDW
jgi:hypothetical protein